MRTPLLVAMLCAACGTEAPPAVEREAPATYGPKQQGSSGAALGSPCDFDVASARAVLTGATATESFAIGADGVKRTLAVKEGAHSWVSPPVARGDFLAVTTTKLEGSAYVTRVTLFDSRGQQLASAVGHNSYLSELGVVAGWADEGGLLLLSADGSRRVEPELTAAADFGPGGLLPVWRGTGEARELALYDVTTRELTALSVAAAGGSQPMWAGDVLVYLGEQGGMLSLVRRRGATEWVTPIVATGVNAGLEVEQVAAGFAVLVTGSWAKQRSRLDLETGVLTPMNVKLPAGFLFAGRQSATLADDGSLVAALRHDGTGGLFRSHDGVSWLPMGEQLEGATWVHYAGRRGSWVMSASGVLGGTSAKALAMVPAMGRTLELPSLATGAPDVEELSSDGRCVAVWSGSATAGFKLEAVDLVKGTSRVLLEGVTARPSAAAWAR